MGRLTFLATRCELLGVGEAILGKEARADRLDHLELGEEVLVLWGAHLQKRKSSKESAEQ